MTVIKYSLFALIMSAAGSVYAQNPWNYFEPPPDSKFDWIQLTSDEWLKGELKMVYDDTVEFDSDEFELQTFDLEDVQRIRTVNRQKVLVEISRPSFEHFWSFNPRKSLRETEVKEMTGLIELKDDMVTITDGDVVTDVSLSQIVALAQEANREHDRWSGDLSLGVTLMSGNSENSDAVARANLLRRTARSRYSFSYSGNYGESSGTATVNNHRFNAAYDRFMTTRFYLQLIGFELYHDPFVNIRAQYSLYTGAGYYLTHNDKIKWSVGSAVGYQKTGYETVLPGEAGDSDSPFLALLTRFDHELTKKIDLLYEYSMRWLNEESGTYTHSMLGQIEFDLTDDLDFEISASWDRIKTPTADENGILPKQDDYRLMIGLGYEF